MINNNLLETVSLFFFQYTVGILEYDMIARDECHFSLLLSIFLLYKEYSCKDTL